MNNLRAAASVAAAVALARSGAISGSRVRQNRYDTEPKNTAKECARRVRQMARLAFRRHRTRDCDGCIEDAILCGEGLCFEHRCLRVRAGL